MFTSGRDLCQAVQVNQLLAWNTAVHQLLNISLFSFPVPPSCSKVCPGSFFLMSNKIVNKEKFLVQFELLHYNQTAKIFPPALAQTPLSALWSVKQ